MSSDVIIMSLYRDEQSILFSQLVKSRRVRFARNESFIDRPSETPAMVSPRFLLRSVGGVANVAIDFETDRAAMENEIESLSSLFAFLIRTYACVYNIHTNANVFTLTGEVIVELSADKASYVQESK